MSPFPPFRIRPAELRDVPRITTVCLDALPDDPGFVYLWRYRHQYPDDSYFFWLQVFKDWLYDPKTTLVVAEQVASIDSKREDRGDAVATIFAFGVWQRNEGTKGVSHIVSTMYREGFFATLHRIITKIENWAISKEYTRRDGDWNRLLAFVKTLDYTRSKYWEKKYPQNYYLALLATHPDYRRRGAGTALTQWGMEKALAEGFDVGLEASPMGFPVYKHLGFEFLEEVVVQVEGDDAKISLKVMVYEGKGKLFGENEEEKKLSGDWV